MREREKVIFMYLARGHRVQVCRKRSDLEAFGVKAWRGNKEMVLSAPLPADRAEKRGTRKDSNKKGKNRCFWGRKKEFPQRDCPKELGQRGEGARDARDSGEEGGIRRKERVLVTGIQGPSLKEKASGLKGGGFYQAGYNSVSITREKGSKSVNSRAERGGRCNERTKVQKFGNARKRLCLEQVKDTEGDKGSLKYETARGSGRGTGGPQQELWGRVELMLDLSIIPKGDLEGVFNRFDTPKRGRPAPF